MTARDGEGKKNGESGNRLLKDNLSPYLFELNVPIYAER